MAPGVTLSTDPWNYIQVIGGGGGEEDPFYELPFVVVERSLVAGGATVSGACGCGKGGGALRPLPP